MSRLNPIKIGLLGLIFVLAACSSGGGTETGGIPPANGSNPESSAEQTPATVAPAPTLELPRDENGNLIVARVNGEGITFADYERTLDRYRAQGGDFDALLDRVLDTLIEQKLIAQAAIQQGITITEADVTDEYQAHRDLVESEQAWNDWLTANAYTDEEFRNEIIPEQLLTTRLRDTVTGIQGEEVQEARARHILVNTEQEAQEVLIRVQTEDFASLARELSQDVTTRENGGDLGWFIREDLFTPELADVAFGLQPGQVAGPVPTMLGYHVIQTLELRTRIALEEELALIAEQQFADYLAGLLVTATIERFI